MKAVKKVAAKKAARPGNGPPKYKGGRLGSNAKLKEELAKSSGSGFVWSVADGVTAEVRFLTEPADWHTYYQHYDTSAKSFYTCIERDNGCEYCEEGDRPGKRFLANVLDMADKRVRALAVPITVAEILYKRLNKFHTLTDRVYEISRDGSGKDNTKYDVEYQPPRPFNTAKYELLDLDEIIASQIPGQQSKADDDDDDFLPPKGKTKKARPTIADDDDDDDPPFERPTKRVAKKATKRAFRKR